MSTKQFSELEPLPRTEAAADDGARRGVIVVGLDRSETAAKAARRAAEVAAESGARLHLVMAVDAAVSYEMVVGTDLFRVDNRADGHDFLGAVGRSFEGIAVTTEVSDESPARALVDAAKRVGAGTIVVGNRRVQGASRVLGSVATDVLRRADCDVLVVDTTGGR